MNFNCQKSKICETWVTHSIGQNVSSENVFGTLKLEYKEV